MGMHEYREPDETEQTDAAQVAEDTETEPVDGEEIADPE